MQCVPQIAVDRKMSGLVLVQFRRVDVDVDDLAVLGEFADLARDAVVKADAERQEQVGLINGVVRIDGAVHAEHVQAKKMLTGESAEPVQRQGHGDAGLVREFRSSPAAPMDDAAAGVNDGSFTGADQAATIGSQFFGRRKCGKAR